MRPSKGLTWGSRWTEAERVTGRTRPCGDELRSHTGPLVSKWRKPLAGALTALVCLFGLTATVAASGASGKHRRIDPRSIVTGQDGPAYDGRKPTDHPKLDRKLNERADKGGSS